MYVFCALTGILFILYCIAIFFVGYGTKFFLVWGFMGAVLLFWARFGRRVWACFPGILRKILILLFIAGLLLFVSVEGMVVSGFFAKGKPGLDYIVVPGAQLKESGPSVVLRLRLDEAYDYLAENEGTVVIVSGGQGANEPDTEAQGMYEYLVRRGIEPERIIREDRSMDTSENIAFSFALMEKEDATVGIVTNNFHIFRAVRLARAAGCGEACGIAAPSNIGLLPNNMLREFFGVLKDFFVGNLY